jgi:hypothetical protein
MPIPLYGPAPEQAVMPADQGQVLVNAAALGTQMAVERLKVQGEFGKQAIMQERLQNESEHQRDMFELGMKGEQDRAAHWQDMYELTAKGQAINEKYKDAEIAGIYGRLNVAQDALQLRKDIQSAKDDQDKKDQANLHDWQVKSNQNAQQNEIGTKAWSDQQTQIDFALPTVLNPMLKQTFKTMSQELWDQNKQSATKIHALWEDNRKNYTDFVRNNSQGIGKLEIDRFRPDDFGQDDAVWGDDKTNKRRWIARAGVNMPQFNKVIGQRLTPEEEAIAVKKNQKVGYASLPYDEYNNMRGMQGVLGNKARTPSNVTATPYRPLDKATMINYYKKAGGNAQRATQMAIEDGYDPSLPIQ